MVSLDEYHYEVPNINILRNVIEAHAEDYPMYQGDRVPWSQWLTLSAVCASNCVLVGTDDEGKQAFAIFDIGYDPHVVGSVLTMQMTVSNSPKAMSAITKRLLRIAYNCGCSYIWMSRRTGAYSYSGTFHKLREKSNGIF